MAHRPLCRTSILAAGVGAKEVQAVQGPRPHGHWDNKFSSPPASQGAIGYCIRAVNEEGVAKALSATGWVSGCERLRDPGKSCQTRSRQEGREGSEGGSLVWSVCKGQIRAPRSGAS